MATVIRRCAIHRIVRWASLLKSLAQQGPLGSMRAFDIAIAILPVVKVCFIVGLDPKRLANRRNFDKTGRSLPRSRKVVNRVDTTSMADRVDAQRKGRPIRLSIRHSYVPHAHERE
jgi:hypothetical protein